MRKGYTSGLLVVVGFAILAAFTLKNGATPKTELFSAVQTADDREFLSFITKHGKSYGTKEEFQFRSEVFKKNLAIIRDENMNSANTFTLAVNMFADRTTDEYKRRLGYKPIIGPKNITVQSFDPSISIPTSIDWRELGAVNPVKDQGDCGSCWAFSAVAGMEGRYQIKRGTLYTLAEQQLVDCCHNGYSFGCNGGDEDAALDYARDYAMMEDLFYPYKAATDFFCWYDSYLITPVKPINHTQVQQFSAKALKTAISEGPTLVAIEADQSVFQFYSGGILNSDKCGTVLDHAVAAIGYGADPTKGEYYIVRNSWGYNWGIGGYVYIAGGLDGPGICGIQQDASYPNF